ncbi:MAG: metalloregulator ArsR/SmtB family transcription factor [Acidimicrobiales bacterium]|nr:metalloregulator ArsR/SmtB family transcription factor [Acidimicrobiales bacterium]
MKSRRRRDRGWCSPSERTDIELASKLFRSLGDPMPLAIIEILADGEHRVIDLVHRLDSSQPNVSGHLACLKECGLVTDRPEGRAVRYRLAHDELFDLLRAGETLLSRTGDDIALCPNLVSNPHGAVPSERTDP